MKWFDDWFERKSRQAWERGAEKLKVKNVFTAESLSPYDSLTNSECTTFKLFKANGGTIIQILPPQETISFSTASILNQQAVSAFSKPVLYIIPDGADIGAEISKILTFQALRS